MKDYLVTINVTTQRVADILCTAIETRQSADVWMKIKKYIAPREYDFYFSQHSVGKQVKGRPRVTRHIDYPLNPGGALIVTTWEGDEIDGKTEWRVDRESIARGMNLLAGSKEHAHHWRDFISEDGDITTADIFMQYCTFGKIEYE